MNEADPESDSKHFVGVIIECLFLLKKIPDAVEVHCSLIHSLRGNVIDFQLFEAIIYIRISISNSNDFLQVAWNQTRNLLHSHNM